MVQAMESLEEKEKALKEVEADIAALTRRWTSIYSSIYLYLSNHLSIFIYLED